GKELIETEKPFRCRQHLKTPVFTGPSRHQQRGALLDDNRPCPSFGAVAAWLGEHGSQLEPKLPFSLSTPSSKRLFEKSQCQFSALKKRALSCDTRSFANLYLSRVPYQFDHKPPTVIASNTIHDSWRWQ
ncbi:MAG: hypothetical protein WCA56_13595, partial [Xanthobacteraceae bacterium]